MKSIFVALMTATLASPAAAAVEGCVAGTWWADISDLADMMALQMDGSARAVGGDVRMDVSAGGDFRITVRNLRIDVQVPGSPMIPVTVIGYSAGNIDAADNVWRAVVPDYSLTGSADVMGATMSIPFTSGTGMFGGGLGWFDCSATQLRFETDPSRPMQMVRTWQRG